MLLIDRVESFGPGPRATAVKNVTGSEPWFPGHFPDRYVLPGVLAVEACAQLAGIVQSLDRDGGAGAGPALMYFAGIQSARFRRPIVPGDQMQLTAERTAGSVGIVQFRGTVRVG